MGGQLRLKLERAADFSRDRFIVSAPNQEAARTLDHWPDQRRPDQRDGALALIGPAGVGKTHLVRAWAVRTGAEFATLSSNPDRPTDSSGPMALDAADDAPHGEALFHLLNNAAQPGACLLLAGRTPPKTWMVEVPDLRSRLNAIPVVTLGEPDDAILRGVLIKLFQERNIRPSPDLLAYLVRRMERSVPAAQAMVAALDEAGSAGHRPISRALAREILRDDTVDESEND